VRRAVGRVAHVDGVHPGLVTKRPVQGSQTPNGWFVAAGSIVIVTASDAPGCLAASPLASPNEMLTPTNTT
jgi:hypothetical protein